MLHTASLLIDDIEDGSTMRRGIPCAHKVYGIPNTINTANYVYFLALEKTHMLKNPEASKVFMRELLNLHRGQGQDIAWRESSSCPSMEEYKQMVKDKTGGLFRLAVSLMRCFSVHFRTSNADKASTLSELVDTLALYFQIRDDFINLADSSYMEQKTFCEDLTEGKFSFVIIHAIRNSPRGDNRVLNILKQRVTDIQIKKYALKVMWELGSFQYTRNILKDMHDKIIRLIHEIGKNVMLLRLLVKLDSQLDSLLDMKKSRLVRELSSDRGDGDDADGNDDECDDSDADDVGVTLSPRRLNRVDSL
jgi:geranylgeranyl diphosphate synthase, type III